MLKTPRASARGLTLIEVMIGTLIAVFLTSAAVLFATQQTRLLGHSSEQIEMHQSARAALDLLAYDLQMAGAGIGYDAGQTGVRGPRFVGLQTGFFRAINPPAGGGEAFNNFPAGQNRTDLFLRGTEADSARGAFTYTFPTRDLGIMYADGPNVTIAQHSSPPNGSGFFCDANNLLPINQPQYVIMRMDNLITSRSAILVPTSAAGPGLCPSEIFCGPNFPPFGVGDGCRRFDLLDDPLDAFDSDDRADEKTWGGGEAHTGFKQVIWWVQNNADIVNTDELDRANLRRAEIDQNNACAAGANARDVCGGEVAYNVETLHYQVWRWDRTLLAGGNAAVDDNRWTPVPPGPIDPPIARFEERDRLRVEIELVVRSQRADERLHPGVRVVLANRCIPGNVAGLPPMGVACPANDHVSRRVYRISVDVKNSGRMRNDIL